ncbi:uncharacterized protein [Dermacentor albipictus]|uniref:uncharacterized protein n=1 Tax=Dermacentor albipictus TaxID=60249 RepID=UPI0031FC765C
MTETEMSLVESEYSVAPSTEQPRADQSTDSRKIWGVVCCVLLAIGMIAVLLFAMRGSEGVDDKSGESADNSGGGNDDTGGTGSYSKGPSAPTSTLPKKTTTAPITAKKTSSMPARSTSTPAKRSTTTTTIAPLVPPLMCSVSETAMQPFMYPDDGLCDIIIYTHLVILNNTLRSLVYPESYDTFQNVCFHRYAKTSCGISFNARYIKHDQLTKNEMQRLEKIRPHNIKHYGILNIYGNLKDVANFSADLGPITKKLRSLIKDSHWGVSSHIILGFGLDRYDSPTSYSDLQNSAKRYTPNDVSIVVFITSILEMPDRYMCKALPNNAWKSPNRATAQLAEFLPLKGSAFKAKASIVAFAFQMGLLTYNMSKTYQKLTDAIYSSCVGFTISSLSQACERVNMFRQLLEQEKIVAGISSFRNWTYFYTYETASTLLPKAELTMSSKNKDRKFSWLLLNVHLTDLAKLCAKPPFYRLKDFRKFYYEYSQKLVSG